MKYTAIVLSNSKVKPNHGPHEGVRIYPKGIFFDVQIENYKL